MSTDTSADTSGLGGRRPGSEGSRLESRAGQASRAGRGVTATLGAGRGGRQPPPVSPAQELRSPRFFLLRAESKCQADVNTKVQARSSGPGAAPATIWGKAGP